MGTIHITLDCGLTIGQPFDIAYAVDPVGDATITPSDLCLFMRF